MQTAAKTSNLDREVIGIGTLLFHKHIPAYIDASMIAQGV